MKSLFSHLLRVVRFLIWMKSWKVLSNVSSAMNSLFLGSGGDGSGESVVSVRTGSEAVVVTGVCNGGSGHGRGSGVSCRGSGHGSSGVSSYGSCVDISRGGSSGNVHVRLSRDLGIDVRLSGDLDIDVRLSSDLFVNVGLSSDLFVDVGLSEG